MSDLQRRQFLAGCVGGAVAAVFRGQEATANSSSSAGFATRWKLGIRHITTFAAWIDAKYKERFGNLASSEEYGAGLSAVTALE